MNIAASGSQSPPTRTVTEIVSEHPLFKDLPSPHLAILSGAAMLAEFKEGQTIFLEGEPANRFYLILEGEVALESDVKDQRPVVFQTIGANDVLGWSWLFPPYYWHFGARAVKSTKAVFFYGTWLREACEKDSSFGFEMMKRMAGVIIKRLQATRKRLVHRTLLLEPHH